MHASFAARFVRGRNLGPWFRLNVQSRMLSFPSCLPSSAFEQYCEGNNEKSEMNHSVTTRGRLLQAFCAHIDQTSAVAPSAYELTMPLLTASVLGSTCWNTLNLQPREMMSQLIHLIEQEVSAGSMKPACEAWLRGRIILASDSCGMQDYPAGYGWRDLSRLIDSINKTELDPGDAAMRCWASSYLMQSLARREGCAVVHWVRMVCVSTLFIFFGELT